MTPDPRRAARALRLLTARAGGPGSPALDEATIRAAARILRGTAAPTTPGATACGEARLAPGHNLTPVGW